MKIRSVRSDSRRHAFVVTTPRGVHEFPWSQLELVPSTDDPVADIGAKVGWPDPSHFARRFRQVHGCGPRAYRVSSRALRSQRSPLVVPTVGSARA